MRFISMVKHAEANAAPQPKEFLEAMGALTQEAAEAGCVMIAGEGLLPTAKAARVRLDGGAVTVMDGPFTEAKEVIGGYALLKASSKEEILKHTKRFLEVAGQGTCEIYPLYEMPEHA